MNALLNNRCFLSTTACIAVLVLLFLVACSEPVPVALLPPDTASTEAASSPATLTPTVSPLPQPSAAPSRMPADPTASATTPLLSSVDPLPVPELAFDGAAALAHVEAQMQWVPRHPGTPGWQQTGDYIIEQVQAAGWQVEEQRFEYKGVPVRNIIAKRGTGPVLILGAHYDTRKYADRDPDPLRRHEPVPGANDGASGVAVLLELARHIDTERLGREVWLAFFDAEDNGRINGWEWAIGSRYMAQNLSIKPEAMILVDMIGDADLQIYYERSSTPALCESIWSTAAELGYDQFIPQEKHAIFDDHVPFLEQGIPAVDLIDFDYPYWHTVEDTIDKVSAASLEAVGRTLERWLQTRGATLDR